MNLLSGLLPKLTPLVDATAKAVGGSIKQLDTAFNGPGFAQFIKFVSVQIGPVLHSLTDTLIRFGAGFGKLIQDVQPLTNVVLGQVNDLAKGFQGLTANPQFIKFINDLSHDMQAFEPVVAGLFTLLGHLLQALEPLVRPALQFLDVFIKALAPLIPALATFVGYIVQMFQALANTGALDALANTFAAILDAIGPILPIIGQFIGELVTGLSPIL